MINYQNCYQNFRKGMEEFGNCLQAIVNTGLLLAVYLLGVGLTFIAAGIMGKHFLFIRKPKNNQQSYWQEFSAKEKDLNDYYRQF